MKEDVKNLLEKIKAKAGTNGSINLTLFDDLEELDINYCLWFEGKVLNHYKLQDALKEAGLCYVENTSNLYLDKDNILTPLENVAHWCDEIFFPEVFKDWDSETTHIHRRRSKEEIVKNIEKKLFSLPIYDLNKDFLNDTKNTCYLYVNKGVIEIKKNSVSLKQYKDIQKKIFAKQIKKDLNFSPEADWKNYRSLKFYKKVTEDNQNKFKFLCTILGSVIWRYKRPGKNKIPVFVDGFTDTKKVGGTGKSLICENIEYIRNVLTLHSPTFNRFLYQNVKESHDVVSLEDVQPQSLKLKHVRSFMDAHLEVEKKGKTPIILEKSACPSATISTNYILHDNEDADLGRVHQFCMPEIFRRGVYEVSDFLGYYMFTDYNKSDWQHYLAFMIYCVQLTLQNNGVYEYNEFEKLKQKEILDKEKNRDFEIIFNYLRNILQNAMNAKKEYKIFWNEVAESLQEFNKIDKKYLSTSNLRENLRSLLETEYKGLELKVNQTKWHKDLKKSVRCDLLTKKVTVNQKKDLF